MTAVEWLLNEMGKLSNGQPTEAMTMYAKKLEKQQIIDAWENGAQAEHRAKVTGLADSNSYSYYNETYGNKGNNYLIVEANEMIDHIGESNEMVSDEEIEKAWSIVETTHVDKWVSFKSMFIEGAKWYREQLKQRQ